ncbi:hypothetical protein GCM10022286_21090 [Gryllotalpicola daejeonensis]|uniref:Uncharacterized protein n=1 Tax=Gryllotalpicola daejeonensis TaxID=993087 RepID=A0ABP7ZKY4_9MICO
MTALPAELTEPQRATARACVRAAETDCLQLFRLLPALHDWSGPARWAFGLRVERLRARIAAAAAALAAAEREL